MVGYFVTIALLFSATSFSAPFFISEIYARHVDRGHINKQWLELALKQPIGINKLEIETYDKNEVLKHSFHAEFITPVNTSSYLVIAAMRDLGLPYCLRYDGIVVVPTLQFDYRKTKRICVTINGDRDCVNFDLSTTIPGIARYRDDSSSLLWRHEPCQLADTIFATPGKPARYCSSPAYTADEEPIIRCPYKPFFGDALSYKKVTPQSNHAPVIKHARVTQNQRQIQIGVSFTDSDYGPWTATICHAHRDTKKICHVMGSRHRVFPEVENKVPIAQKTLPPHHYISIEIADVTGALARTVVAYTDDENSPFANKPWLPSIKRRLRADGLEELLLSLTTKDLPLNVLLWTDTAKFYQGAFVHPGEHSVVLPNQAREHVVTAVLTGPQGQQQMTFN